MSEASDLRQKISSIERELNQAKNRLKSIELECRHSWGETIADHIFSKGYTIPGDPYGTMGVDWRGSYDVPSKTEYRWKRVCQICGKIEYTSKINEVVTKTPKF